MNRNVGHGFCCLLVFQKREGILITQRADLPLQLCLVKWGSLE
jgi:hypothetical protein